MAYTICAIEGRGGSLSSLISNQAGQARYRTSPSQKVCSLSGGWSSTRRSVSRGIWRLRKCAVSQSETCYVRLPVRETFDSGSTGSSTGRQQNSSKLRTERVSSSKQGSCYRSVSMHIAWGELFAPACRRDFLKPEQRKSGELMHSSLCTTMPLAVVDGRYQGGFKDTGMDLIKVGSGRGVTNETTTTMRR